MSKAPVSQWYVTFSGESGKKGVTTPINNVIAVDTKGKVLGEVLAALPPDIQLSELRGMALGSDGTLYVAIAKKNVSQILAFSARINHDGRSRNYLGVAADGSTTDGLLHPYGVSFGPDGDMFVSSQDTCVVSRFTAPGNGNPYRGSRATDTCPYLKSSFPGGSFLAGTFVACANPPGAGITPVPASKGGLTNLDESDPKPVRRSVRGFVFDARTLYVADEAANRIAIYDSGDGEFQGAATDERLQGPVGLALNPANGHIVIGSAGSKRLFSYHPDSCELHELAHDDRLDGVSGIACDPSGLLYVSCRKALRISVWDEKRGFDHFAGPFSDTPECLLGVTL
jgi:DNA-binding beta-propeller fold protein YncE